MTQVFVGCALSVLWLVSVGSLCVWFAPAAIRYLGYVAAAGACHVVVHQVIHAS